MNRIQGTGLGLRPCHYSHIEKERPPIPWFEVLTDNYLHDHGPGLKQLEKNSQSLSDDITWCWHVSWFYRSLKFLLPQAIKKND